MSQLGQELQPLLGPLLCTIAPFTSPLGITPRVANHNEAFAIAGHRSKDGIRMIPNKTLHFSTRNATPITAKVIEGTTKETTFVCAGKFFIPKLVNVEYVLAAKNRRDTTSPYRVVNLQVI
jgi:hypothetical protein